MYKPLKVNAFSSKPPFHNHVLRSVYEIDKARILLLVKQALSDMCNGGKLYTASDEMEDESFVTFLKNEFDLKDLESIISREQTGIFDETLTFYIRTWIEPVENVAKGEKQCGFLEIYAKDSTLFPLFKSFSTAFEDFFVLSSAKKHLDEILL